MAQLPSITYTLETIDQAATRFWQQAADYHCFAFSGGLGAGKTTFIHALCDLLGVTDAVSSPTFALINEYHFDKAGRDKIIYHMDWYRLRDEEEAIHAGMEDAILNPEAYTFIEWPEQAPGILHSPYLWITIEPTGDSERKMSIEVR